MRLDCSFGLNCAHEVVNDRQKFPRYVGNYAIEHLAALPLNSLAIVFKIGLAPGHGVARLG